MLFHEHLLKPVCFVDSGGGGVVTSLDCELISVCGLVRVIDLLVY